MNYYNYDVCFRQLVFDAVVAGDELVIKDVRRVAGFAPDSSWLPSSPQEIAQAVMHTCYMGTVNSSEATRSRARQLAKEVGTFHSDISIDAAVAAVVQVFGAAFGRVPQFLSSGGSLSEDLSLQNIQVCCCCEYEYMSI